MMGLIVSMPAARALQQTAGTSGAAATRGPWPLMNHVPAVFRVSYAPLSRGLEAAALALLSSAAGFVTDVRFLAGALLGWRMVASVGAAATAPHAHDPCAAAVLPSAR